MHPFTSSRLFSVSSDEEKIKKDRNIAIKGDTDEEFLLVVSLMKHPELNAVGVEESV